MKTGAEEEAAGGTKTGNGGVWGASATVGTGRADMVGATEEEDEAGAVVVIDWRDGMYAWLVDVGSGAADS